MRYFYWKIAKIAQHFALKSPAYDGCEIRPQTDGFQTLANLPL